MIVMSFWGCKPGLTLFLIWLGRRRRKPSDKVLFHFQDTIFQRLIVALNRVILGHATCEVRESSRLFSDNTNEVIANSAYGQILLIFEKKI